MSPSYSVFVVLTWMLLCAGVFQTVDWVATRPVEVYLEDFRALDRSDEEVLVEALQHARSQGRHWWWIHQGSAVIVIDSTREYQIHPAVLASVDVPMVQHVEPGRVIVVHAIPAVRTR